MNLHFFFIALHTLTGVIAFITGWITIAQLKKTPEPATLWVYLISLIGIVVFMLGAIVSHWMNLAGTPRFVYVGLFVLGCYMLVRAYQAYKVQEKQEQHWQSSYIEHVGFTLISLFDGFVIVSAIDLGIPVWGVIIIGVLGVVVGRYGIRRAQSSLMIST